MNDTTEIPLLSSDSPQNPQNTTGYHDKTPTSPIEALLNTITVNFGRISQNKLNFAARVHSLTAQKNQKKPKNHSYLY
jgi:hypothetical protein